MPSSYTTSLRFELQFTGENVNLWGDKLNAALSRADDAIAGWLSKPLTGDYTLSTANGAADEARKAMLKFTGTGAFTVTVPAAPKRYDVWNACSGDLTVTNGSASVAVKAGEVVSVVTDGGGNIARVQPAEFGGATLTGVAQISGLSPPTSSGQVATKGYVDATAFNMAAGSLPGQAGNVGKFLTTNGSAALWATPFASPIITAPIITGGATIDTLTVSGAASLGAGLTLTGSTRQNVTAVSGTSLDLAVADFFTKSISTNTVFAFTNPSASNAQGFLLDLTITSGAVPSWPGAVKWAFGSIPTLGNGRHMIGFITDDGGTTYVGIVGAQAVA